MAQSLGSKIQAALVGVLIFLLVVAFAVWGINDVFSPNSKRAVMSLGSNDVSTAEFDREFRRELSSLALQEGKQLPHQEAFDRGIHRQILQRLMTSKVIEIDADDLGIGVNTRSARDYVSEIEAFQNELTGEFEERKLMETLSRMRPAITRADFEKDLIDDLRQRQTIPAINGGVVAPLAFAEQRYQYLTEQRKAKVLTLNNRAVPAPPEPTDAQLETFISENPIPFTAPEYRRLTILRLETFDMTPDLSVTETEIKEYFDYKVDLGEIGSPETRSVAQITAPDEETAKKAAERLEAGEDAAAVALLLNLIEPTIYEDVVSDAILLPETAEAAFALAQGKTATVLGSLGNWYAVQATKVTPAVRPDFDGIRAELEADLLKNKAEEKLFDITPAIEDTLDSGGTLEEAAEAAGVAFGSVDYIDRSGTTQDGRKLDGFDGVPGIALDETLLIEIFTNDMGYPTDMFQTATGGWAVIRVDDIIGSKLRDFEKNKSRAKAMWTTQQINDSLDELALTLAKRAQDGETLNAILDGIENGGEIEDVIIVRSNPGQKIGPRVTAGLLDASVGDIERGPGSKPLTRQIALLTDIVENRDGLAGQYADILQDQATAAIRSDLNIAYQTAVLADNPVTEYPDKVKSVLGLDTEE